jgi:hypothetical protein
LLHSRSSIADSLGLAIDKPYLDETPLVGFPTPTRVLVAEVNLHAGNLVSKPSQGISNLRFNSLNEFLTSLDVVVGIHLHLHVQCPTFNFLLEPLHTRHPHTGSCSEYAKKPKKQNDWDWDAKHPKQAAF